MKNNKGITLIALVVTIIVLLILAGVSIAMLTGDNGILNRASESSVANAIGEGKDQVGLKVAELTTNYYDHKYNGATVDPAVGESDTTVILYIINHLESKLETSTEYTVNVTATSIKVTSAKDTTKYAECTIDATGKIGAWDNQY